MISKEKYKNLSTIVTIMIFLSCLLLGIHIGVTSELNIEQINIIENSLFFFIGFDMGYAILLGVINESLEKEKDGGDSET